MSVRTIGFWSRGKHDHRGENEMYGLAQYEVWRQQRRPYVVVRDLSWELARYLDTQDFGASASATANSASEHHLRTTPEKERAID